MKRTNKILLTLFLAGMMIVGMAACDGEDSPAETSNGANEQTVETTPTKASATTPPDKPDVPDVTTTAPTPTTETPITTKTPVTTTEAPVTTTEAPVTTTEAPVTTTEAPVTTTEAPVTTTEAPVTTTKAPVTTTEAPVTTTKAPVTTPKAPVTTTKAPVTTTKAPVTTTKAPVTTTKAPVTTTNTPVTEPTPVECSHNYSVSATTDATCTAKGSKTYTCSKCGDSYSEEIAIIAHKYTAATCAQPKTCKACGGTEGDALGHDYSNDICTRCEQRDPNAPKPVYTYSPFYNISPYSLNYICGPIHDNGQIDYDIIVDKCWRYFHLWEAPYVDPNNPSQSIIPEDQFIAKIKDKFVISDAQIDELKAASPYAGIGGNHHYYDNGYFYITDSGAGGESLNYLHFIVSYTAKNGVLTTYIDYTTSGIYDNTEPTHQFYYAVEYHYTGISDFRIYSDENGGKIVSNSKPLIDSLRIASIYIVDQIPADALPAQTPLVDSSASYTIYSYYTSSNHFQFRVEDSAPTIAKLTAGHTSSDNCTSFIFNNGTTTCECGNMVLTDAELTDQYRFNKYIYE